MKDAFTDTLQPAGYLTFNFSQGDCWIDAPFVTRCEAACSTDASCQEKGILDRCAKEEQVGICPARCTGTCEGSAAVPASCEGTCDASCEGTCVGDCNGTCEGTLQPGGRCRGECIGLCQGVCKGKCTGVCHFAKSSSGRCDGPCKGGCSVPLKAPKCEADLKSAACPGNPDCDTNCKAIGQARASCTAPSVTVGLSQDIAGLPDALALIRSLEINMPKLFNAIQGRGPELEKEASAAVQAGEKIVADKGEKGKLRRKGTACAIVMQQAGELTVQNFHLASAASKSVIASLPSAK